MELSNKEKLKKVSQAKSDQLNADDLFVGNLKMRISAVKISLTPQQPVFIYYDGDNGKPWKPSKGMYRLLAMLIDEDPDAWVGHWIEVFRRAEVVYAGDQVGGIQISQCDTLKSAQTYSITASKAKKMKVTVHPFVHSSQQAQQPVKSPSRIAAEQLAAAAKVGSLALEQAWAKVPENLRDQKMDDYYNTQCGVAAGVDAQGGFEPVPAPTYQQQIESQQPAHSEQADVGDM